jgi:hypothetical protein
VLRPSAMTSTNGPCSNGEFDERRSVGARVRARVGARAPTEADASGRECPRKGEGDALGSDPSPYHGGVMRRLCSGGASRSSWACTFVESRACGESWFIEENAFGAAWRCPGRVLVRRAVSTNPSTYLDPQVSRHGGDCRRRSSAEVRGFTTKGCSSCIISARSKRISPNRSAILFKLQNH